MYSIVTLWWISDKINYYRQCGKNYYGHIFFVLHLDLRKVVALTGKTSVKERTVVNR